MRLALLVATLLAGTVAHADRYEDARLSVDAPRGFLVEAMADPTGEWAVVVKRLTDAEQRFVVLLGGKVGGDKEVEALAEKWHAARMRNHTGWGTHAEGGPPREWVHLGDKRCVRFRDRLRGALRPSEEVMTCGAVAGQLGCVVSVAPSARQAAADPIAAQLLRSLQARKK